MSELPTAILDDAADSSSTRRLEQRATSLGPEFRTAQRQNFSVSKKRRWAPVILIGVVVLIAMSTLAWAAFVRHRNTAVTSDAWIYPGSQTVVDTTTADGRAVQLRTSDPFDKVVAWYSAKLKPTKTMQLNQSIVVMRSGNVIVTLGAENNTTSILIKESP